jgi:glycosyltransferase involved in cell wall biosynthesis
MLLEGPFESDYSLAIVNRRLALALLRLGQPTQLHQRDNTTDYPPSIGFLTGWPQLAPCFLSSIENSAAEVHSRYIYPPYTDRMVGKARAVHCYGWEESVFPQEYVASFNRDLDVITVMSTYVKEVLVQNGVKVPIEITGLGADHILESPAEPVGCLDCDRFNFVHVSSCFPRKGGDVLVEAFCREFRRGEDVSLLIKTFANPHNEIEKKIAEAFSLHRQHAPITVIFDPWSPGRMRSLMEQANCLVAPSRGEGFGLPVAESMLLGTPVIATIHGGHADLCSSQWCWPVDFRLEPAHTHLSKGRSFWAEPDLASLQAAMREVYESHHDIIQQRTARARAHVAARFTWKEVAQRHAEACERALDKKRRPSLGTRSSSPLHIGFITTWNARCGIAEYTRFLSESLSPERAFSVFANRISDTVRDDEPNVARCWTAGPDDLPRREIDELVRRVCEAGCEVVSIQFNFSLLSPDTIDGLVRQLRRKGIPVVVTLHGTASERYSRLIAILKDAQAVIVHREEERDQLLASGLAHAYLQRQGIYVPKDLQRVTPPDSDAGIFTVACFGFFLPPKGIYELLQAFSAAAFVNPALRLKLINSLYDLPESHAYASECIRFLRNRGLSDRVMISTGFLDQDIILRELADSDLVVLPYMRSTESSSAAIRLPLASLTPVLCSDLRLFREFTGIVHHYPAQDTVALANRLLELSLDTRLLRTFEAGQRRYVDELAWSNVARDFEKVIDSCTLTDAAAQTA